MTDTMGQYAGLGGFLVRKRKKKLITTPEAIPSYGTSLSRAHPARDKSIAAPEAKAWHELEPIPSFHNPITTLTARVTELEGDLVRIVELIIHGDIDSAKFREILNRRQGKA